EAIKTHGAGSGSVRPIAGNMDLDEELERRSRRFKRRKAAWFYMSGFAGNAGLIPQLAGEGDAILTDELNHGSIIDGVRLTKAQRVIYRHCDVGDLERALKEVDSWAKKILIITDGVFSMDGDIAPVGDIARVGEEFGAMIYVDDAHGEGVVGDGGRGRGLHRGDRRPRDGAPPRQEALGKHEVLQETTRLDGIRHRTERDADYAGDARGLGDRQTIQRTPLRGRRLRVADHLSDGRQGPGSDPEHSQC